MKSEHVDTVLLDLYASGFKYLSKGLLREIKEHLSQCKTCQTRFKEAARKVAERESAEDDVESHKEYLEVAHGIKGTPFALKGMLTEARKSVLIVGQNLYTLVRDEVDVGNDMKEKGHFRRLIEEWLCEAPERRLQMLLCDPRSSESVVHYAMVFGRDFVKHLCQAVRRYKHWQNEMSDIGLNIMVTNTVPLSLVAIDADDAKNGVMTLTPMAFEPKSAVRPTIVVRRIESRLLFDSYYEAFHQRLILDVTKSVLAVSPNDITECEKLSEDPRLR